MSDPTSAGPRRLGGDPLPVLRRLVERHGAVARYRGGPEPGYLVSRPEHVRRVLADNAANYSKATPINRVVKGAVADGLLTSEGPQWRRDRLLIQPAFHAHRLAVLGDHMTEVAVSTVRRWTRLSESGDPVDIAREMGTLTLRITARALFGVDVGRRARGVDRKVHEGLRALATGTKEEFRAGRRWVERMVLSIIREHERKGESDRQSTEDRPLVSMLLSARDEASGEGLTPQRVVDQMMTLILAGYETTANALSWVWLLLATHRDEARALQEELSGTLQGRPATIGDLASLPRTRAVVDEALRLYPPAWIIGRRALGPDRLDGHEIPAGSVVAISPYLLHRDPDHWERPDDFEPERFLRVRPEHMPFVYLPFGGGPRLCIGHRFALMESQLVVATLAQRFTLGLVPGTSVVPEGAFVLRPRGRLPMTIHRAEATSPGGSRGD